MKHILISFGEISLKKGNRKFFLNTLIRNLQSRLKSIGPVQIRSEQNRLVISSEEQIDKAAKICSETFGIVKLRICQSCNSDWQSIEQCLIEDLQNDHTSQKAQSFAIKARRGDKRFPMDSIELGKNLGSSVLKAFPEWHVNLDNPERLITVDVYAENTYISSQEFPGLGGMPVGSAGKLGLLLSGGIDSPIAGWNMLKRGAKLTAIYFHSFPYTGDKALSKVKDLRAVLSKQQNNLPLYVVHFTQIQEAIRDHCPANYSVVLGRRMMMRLAQKIAQKDKLLGLVTGECLGQVASQTLENMQAVGSATDLQIYRPLISMDKNDIIQIADKLGTLEISNRPYEDCCALFVDKHPVIRAQMDTVLELEDKLDIETLIFEALQKTEKL